MNELPPSVIFDANNSNHRKAYLQFLKTKSWTNCPYRFKAPHFGITLGYIERTMIEYYVKKEFKQDVSYDWKEF